MPKTVADHDDIVDTSPLTPYGGSRKVFPK